MTETLRSIKYQSIDELEPASRNPKKHDIDKLRASVKHHGFVEPIVVDERTGRLVAGHGRLETLRAMQTAGLDAPSGIKTADGKWLAPVLRGWASENDAQASAYLVASNRLVEAGGWDEGALAELLNEINSEGYLEASGHDERTLEELAESIAASALEGESAGALDGTYTKKIVSPVYTPKGDKPAVAELYNEAKTLALKAEIKTAGLPEDVAGFLLSAAERHTEFRFSKIAEFYCHAPESVQRLFERSGLVIIDFDAAIENGFVHLTEELAALAGLSEAEEDE